MEFLVKLTPHFPDTLTAEELADLLKRERARGIELLKAKKMTRIWRLPGTSSAFLLWEVTGPDELHDSLNSLPVWRYCDVEVTALIQHPLEAMHRGTQMSDDPLKPERL